MSAKKIVELCKEAKKSLHWIVLNNYDEDEMRSYKSELKLELPESDIKKEFPSWFKEKIYCLQKDMPSDCTGELKELAYVLLCAYSYTACIVNGVRFVVNNHDLQRTTQNSGVVTFGEDGQTVQCVVT
ncbi:unnamed protein product [Lactuca saligna]|uniref:Uncharacterized protein n=1 Tax=Lactuca saligna TaxID=75948 RepID=A0AA35YT05_LACSI|nr:unnamed protein product [Lactuca saligna]